MHKEVPVPLVCDLGALISRIPPDSAFPLGDELLALNDFTTVRRYEEMLIPVSTEEIEMAFEHAETVFTRAKNILSE